MALSTASSPPAGLHLFCGGFNYRQLAPALPDFHVCSTFYASNVYLNDCRNAANVLLGTLKSVPFAYTAANLPPPADSGGCRMAIEVGGPYLPPTMEIPSEADIADMARWLISHCVVASNGIGGFVTKNFNQMMGYSVKQGLTVIPPFPVITTFFTLAVYTASAGVLGPGNHDSSTALALSNFNGFFARNYPTSPRAPVQKMQQALWEHQASKMYPTLATGTARWWDP